jgi:hypothetical protein
MEQSHEFRDDATEGEYCRAHLGMSPLKYRKELLRNKV